jgi:hypothetical protein
MLLLEMERPLQCGDPLSHEGAITTKIRNDASAGSKRSFQLVQAYQRYGLEARPCVFCEGHSCVVVQREILIWGSRGCLWWSYGHAAASPMACREIPRISVNLLCVKSRAVCKVNIAWPKALSRSLEEKCFIGLLREVVLPHHMRPMRATWLSALLSTL